MEITDNQGRKTRVEYDLLNREIRRTEKDGGVTRSFYDGNGNRTHKHQLGGETLYHYASDKMGGKLSLLLKMVVIMPLISLHEALMDEWDFLK